MSERKFCINLNHAAHRRVTNMAIGFPSNNDFKRFLFDCKSEREEATPYQLNNSHRRNGTSLEEFERRAYGVLAPPAPKPTTVTSIMAHHVNMLEQYEKKAEGIRENYYNDTRRNVNKNQY